MLGFGQLPIQPRFGLEPVELHGAGREVHGARGLLNGETGEESQLHHVRQSRAFRSHSFERVIKGDHLIRLLGGHRVRVVQTDRFCSAAAFVGLTPPSRVNQNASHRARGDGHEVRAVLVFDALNVDELEIGLVDQRRGRQCVIEAFVREVSMSPSSQLRVDQREECVERVALP